MDDLEVHEEMIEILRRRLDRLRWYEYRKFSEIHGKLVYHEFMAALIRKRRRFPNYADP